MSAPPPPEGHAGTGLAPGRHDAVVVDARWRAGTRPPVLELSLTLVAGALKGEVVEIGFVGGGAALGRALAALGVARPTGGDDSGDAVIGDVLGMPCTLVLARDSAGNLGYALEP